MAVQLPTASEVRAIVKTDLSDSELDVVIADVGALVESCVSALDASAQKRTIKYATAHVLQMTGLVSTDGFSNVSVTSSRLGDASESYARGTMGEGFMSTNYGKLAVQFGGTCLLNIGREPVIFEVL